MCGISGVYANHVTDPYRQLIQAIMEKQFNRGPDYQGTTLVEGRQSQAFLGHNRLSIIDLSEQAHQPMWDTTGRYCIVYNGEIYNYIELREELSKLGYAFRTQSDTEVILNSVSQWGMEALQRFHGPFAFALFDKEKEALWLCRDRFGIRPLYYVQTNNVLYFASTFSVLAKALNLKPNLAYLSQGLTYLVYEDRSDASPYQGIVSLSSGCYLLSQFNAAGQLTFQVYRFYDLEKNVTHLRQTLQTHHSDSLLQHITDTLEKSVTIRLRTDVPLGISLSGGLDSSSVASCVIQQHQNTIGFSFGHPQDKKTEGPLVAHCANFLNMHIEYIAPNGNEMIEALYKTLDVQESPFSSLSVVAQYLLYKRVRACGVKVLLGGQGGDEVFMGYKKFLLFQLQQFLKQKRYTATAKHLLQLLPMLLSELTSLSAYWQHRHRYKKHTNHPMSELHLPDAPVLDLNGSQQPLWMRQMHDITQFSLPTLLRYEDRNAMGNSVESRLPYMDHRLVELGLAIPDTLKLRAGYGKWAIRKIMHNRIPNRIRLARYKRGFDIPLQTLLQAGLGKSIRERLQSNQALIKEFLKQPSDINQLFSDQQLLQRQRAMAEAITLLWLNRVYT